MKIGDCSVAGCLARIAELDSEIQAWVQVAPRAQTADGPLGGVPFGAKDIFETRGMSTAYGSPLYAGRQGEYDAAAVELLARAGAVLLGKTHTTAFASFDPAPTRNPRLPGHTPGGSSSGSAAAVAAGMIPLALGSQTLGSVLRPASYCGVCGFKPTYGRVPTAGMLAFAPTLDTAGLFAATVADMVWVWQRSFGAPAEASSKRLAYFRIPADPAMRHAVEDAAAALGARALDPPEGWHELVDAARRVNDYEGARTHESRYREFGVRLGARLAELIERGLITPAAQCADALDHIHRMRQTMAGYFAGYDAILSPSATGAAPAGFASTGDPRNNAAWTALGVPAISLPLPVNGAPLGLQIAAPWHHDDQLVSLAADLEERLRK
jgi:Asp-tRNA(Asn)/Glu-tRNA(Gln) amidotransferase A subunit family amidase